MAIIKETKYLIFEAISFKGRKTKTVHVINKNSGNPLATIEWYLTHYPEKIIYFERVPEIPVIIPALKMFWR